jgi:hypothetical protein
MNDKSFVAWVAIALLVADRVLGTLTGGDGWLATLGGPALLAFGMGHCDGLDGPVVTSARSALDTGNVNLVLPWVREQDESQVREAFAHARAVRELGAEARELADLHFFETLVRVHRAGEGEPYTGLKPAGRDLGPAIPAADKALEDGSIDRVVALIAEAVRNGVHQHFHRAMEHKSFAPDDVRAGREYVEAYVPYVHYVERLWEDAAALQHAHHGHGGAGHAAHSH